MLSGSLAYAVLAMLSSLSHESGSPISVVWLPTGLLAALAMRSGFVAIPIGLLGSLLNDLSHGRSDLSHGLLLGLAQAATAAVVLLLAPRLMGRADVLGSLRSLFGFLAAVVAASLCCTLIASLALPNLRDWSVDGGALTWWLSDVAGAVILTPLLLEWIGRNSETRLCELRKPEFALLLLLSLLAALLINQSGIRLLSLRPLALLLPLMLWASFRFSPPAATLVLGLQAMVLTMAPNNHKDLLLLASNVEANEELQLVVITVGVSALVSLLVNADRSRTTRQLQQLTGSLERTVVERTGQLAAANAQLRRLSETDGLTGITNRRRFDELLQQRWHEAAQTESSLALAMIDIDHFKAYNDHYGHQAGDACLQQVATALGQVVRKRSDCLARYGGEEFVVLWSDLDLEQAAAMAERLRQRVIALALPHAAHPSGAQVSLSIGVAATAVPRSTVTAPADEQQHQIKLFMQQADQRLYRAKTGGRNRVVAI